MKEFVEHQFWLGDEETDCVYCEGAGWLWGCEIPDADEATFFDDATKYTCCFCNRTGRVINTEERIY
jgi:hypothetical protein